MIIFLLQNTKSVDAFEFTRFFSSLDHISFNFNVVVDKFYDIFNYEKNLYKKVYNFKSNGLAQLFENEHKLVLIDFAIKNSKDTYSDFFLTTTGFEYVDCKDWKIKTNLDHKEKFFSRVMFFPLNYDLNNQDFTFLSDSVVDELNEKCTIDIVTDPFLEIQTIWQLLTTCDMVISQNDIVAHLCNYLEIKNLIIVGKDTYYGKTKCNQIIFDPYRNEKIEYPPSIFLDLYKTIDTINDQNVNLRNNIMQFRETILDSLDEFKLPYKTEIQTRSNNYL